MNSFRTLRPRRPSVLTAVILLSLAPAAIGRAQQSAPLWPGFRGPGADGTVAESHFADADAVSLEIAWKRPIGSGYSGVSVSADIAVTMFVDGDNDIMVAFDPDSGEELWRFPIGPTYRGHDGSFDGPMSTPLLVGNLVIGLSGFIWLLK